MTKRIKLLILIITGSICTASAQQQYYDWRFGAGVGSTYYLGDLSNGLNRNAFAAPSYQVMLGRMISPSFGLELNGTWATINGNDRTRDWRGNLQLDNPNFNRGLNFETTLRSATLQLHYRFNNGVLLSRYARFAPYVFAGGGLTSFRVNSDLQGPDGQPYFYWPDNTIRNQPPGTPGAQVVEQDGNYETRVSNREMGANYPTRVATIPFGAGLQMRLADRLSANLRAEARYAFTDYLDNASMGSSRHDMYFMGTVSLQYHFNAGGKKEFKAPVVYVGYEQPTVAMTKPAPAGNTPATASGNTVNPVGEEWEDISRIPAYRKEDLTRLNTSPDLTAPERLPGRQDAYRNLQNNSRTIIVPEDQTESNVVDQRNGRAVQQERAVRQNEDYESQFYLRRPLTGTNRTYAGTRPYALTEQHNLQLESQRAELRRRQQENAEAIRRSEAEIERLRMQLKETGARTNNQPDNRQETEVRRLTSDEEMRASSLNNRLTGLDNDLQRLRRENDAYRRQLRRLNQTQAAGDLATLGMGINQNQGQQRTAPANRQTQAKLDSLTQMVQRLNSQLLASGNTADNAAPAADTVVVDKDDEDSINTQRLMESLDQLDDQELDSLTRQLSALRETVARLEGQLAEETTVPVSRMMAPYGSMVVYYPLNSAVIGEADKRRLDVLAESVKANPSALMRLSGHTDNTGNAEYNLMLSRRRAEAIRDYLVSKAGVPADRVILNYYGQQKADGQGKSPYDRKVELELYVLDGKREE